MPLYLLSGVFSQLKAKSYLEWSKKSTNNYLEISKDQPCYIVYNIVHRDFRDGSALRRKEFCLQSPKFPIVCFVFTKKKVSN